MIGKFADEYEFLSNFYPIEIKDDDIIYPSLEHAFQAMKSLDLKERRKIASCRSPGRAKRMGEKLKTRPGWDSLKIDIMLGLLEIKFRDRELRKLLLATGDEELVEGNTWKDTFWGVYNGKGENMLGKLLMALRETIREEIRLDSSSPASSGQG